MPVRGVRPPASRVKSRPVQRDRRCRLPATEVVDDLAPTLDRDVDRPVQRPCQVDATRDPSGAPPSLPTTKPMLAATSSSASRDAGPAGIGAG